MTPPVAVQLCYKYKENTLSSISGHKYLKYFLCIYSITGRRQLPITNTPTGDSLAVVFVEPAAAAAAAAAAAGVMGLPWLLIVLF